MGTADQMYHFPFQKLCFVSQASPSSGGIILGATGPHICSFNAATGQLLSRWPHNDEEKSGDEGDHDAANEEERSAKRRKLSSEDSDTSIEIVAQRVKGTRRKPKLLNERIPNVSNLVATSDGSLVIAITTDDKCMRVFRCSANGRLHVQSERCMPKRLCAVKLTLDEKTMIVGDKFGDVYSLPLEPSADWTPKPLNTSQKDHKPSASELTVHTHGNLEALRQQMQQRQSQKKKERPDFEHELLLGHVSLLTDLAIAKCPDGTKRHYILTCDRDEHVRISRGIPQTHVIENYCSGIKEFVTKLCIVPWQPETLVLGGGESGLGFYLWRKGHSWDRVDLTVLVTRSVKTKGSLPPERSMERLAVSGIWAVPLPSDSDNTVQSPGHILVSLEGFPFLFVLVFSPSEGYICHQTLTLSGNVLDLVILPPADDDNARILISLDTVHDPMSVSKATKVSQPVPFSEWTCHINHWTKTDDLAEPLNAAILEDPNIAAPLDPSEAGLVLDDQTKPVEQGQSQDPSANPKEDSPKLTQKQKQKQKRKDPQRRGGGHGQKLRTFFQSTPDNGDGGGKTAAATAPYYSALGEFLYGLENLRKKRGTEAVDADAADGGEADAGEGKCGAGSRPEPSF